ncbi:conjugal transfer protein TraC [Glutamicibacter uratoxydans]|uniref:conjugal transfer protein TraC n=1 Tax=Glutamicibacter uratoxydans TaxID=43667 RepID=UPI003D6F8FCA
MARQGIADHVRGWFTLGRHRQLGVVGVYDRATSKQFAIAGKSLARQTLRAERTAQNLGDQGYPTPRYGGKGRNKRFHLYGAAKVAQRFLPTTSGTGAMVYPWVAGPSLGLRGPYIGDDMYGGGAFCLDPWDLYKRGIIRGMSMIVLGSVGMGKSSCVKSFAARHVLHGRKLAVLSDRKGEWTPVVRWLGGSTIKVAPGGVQRINPLDAGNRPSVNSEGRLLSDEEWCHMVRDRRLGLLEALGAILKGRAMDSEEKRGLSLALDHVVDLRGDDAVLPDIVAFLLQPPASLTGTLRSAAESLGNAFTRCTDGRLRGMFDGPSNVEFDQELSAVSVDTSSFGGTSGEVRAIVNACVGSWVEAMITNPDNGQRICVYEEGWDNISSDADLQRMVDAWKLARHYGIFNILVLHKLTDLDMAGDSGSAMYAKAKSLLGDAPYKVVYQQPAVEDPMLRDGLGLSDREIRTIHTLPMGTGLWMVGETDRYKVRNRLTREEMPIFDTNTRMDVKEAVPA